MRDPPMDRGDSGEEAPESNLQFDRRVGLKRDLKISVEREGKVVEDAESIRLLPRPVLKPTQDNGKCLRAETVAKPERHSCGGRRAEPPRKPRDGGKVLG